MALTYSEEEWAEAAGHRPLREMDVNRIVTLQRHYIWALNQRGHMREAIPGSKSPQEEGDAFYASELFSAWFLWAGLLWAVIEGLDERDVDLRGPLAVDIEHAGSTLRRCRNAVFHVPSEPHDDRYFALMRLKDSVEVMERITSGVGRLFIEEQRARGLAQGRPRTR